MHDAHIGSTVELLIVIILPVEHLPLEVHHLLLRLFHESILGYHLVLELLNACDILRTTLSVSVPLFKGRQIDQDLSLLVFKSHALLLKVILQKLHFHRHVFRRLYRHALLGFTLAPDGRLMLTEQHFPGLLRLLLLTGASILLATELSLQLNTAFATVLEALLRGAQLLVEFA